MKFRVLGPVTVIDGPVVVDVGPPKARAVLGYLLLHANQVVPLDRLLADLWPGQQPAAATAALTVHLSTLRRALEPGRAPGAPPHVLVSRPPGYVLAVPPADIDVREFEDRLSAGQRMMAAGDRAGAEAAFDVALGLWQGEPFGDVGEEPYVRAEGRRLATLRLGALGSRAEALVAQGKNHSVIPSLENFVVEQPFDERGWHLLAVALYRVGRQADALATIAEAHRSLVTTGGGTAPGLEMLELQIKEHDPGLDWQPVADAGTAAGATEDNEADNHGSGGGDGDGDGGTEARPPTMIAGPAFVGRGGPQSALASAVAAARKGTGGLVLVAGEAGTGRTRLCEVLGSAARSAGFTVGWGRCSIGAGPVGFRPWGPALALLAGPRPDPFVPAEAGPPAAGAADAVGEDGPLLAHLGPELEARFGPPEPLGGEPFAARRRLHEAVTGFLSRRAALGPVMIVLDDVELADRSSLRLLLALTPELSSMAVVVVATHRLDAAGATPWAALSRPLSNAARARVSLGPIDRAGVEAYLDAVTGTGVGERAAGPVHDRTGGNPLFLSELVQLLQSEGRLVRADERLGGVATPAAADGTPAGGPLLLGACASAGEVLMRRLARLPASTGDVLTVMAVAGGDIDLDVLGRAFDVDAATAFDRLDPAFVSGLVLADPMRPGHFALSSRSLAETLLAQLDGESRAQVHAALAQAIDVDGAGDPAALAHHYGHALPLGTGPQAVRWAAVAARQATGHGADDEAALAWEAVLAAHGRAGGTDPSTRFDLLQHLSHARRRAGDAAGAQTAQDEAAEIAQRLDDPERMARAASVYGAITLWNQRPYGYVDEANVAVLDRAVAMLPLNDGSLRAQALGALGVELYYGRRRPEGHALARRAVGVARRLGDPELLVRTLNNLAMTCWAPGFEDERLEVTAEILAVPGLSPEIETTTLAQRIPLLLRGGHVADAAAVLARSCELRAVVRAPELVAQLDLQDAMWAAFKGRYGDAERLCEAARDACGETSGWWGGEWRRLSLLFWLRRDQGRLDELHEPLATAAAVAGNEPLVPLAALALAETGDRAGARALAEQRGFEPGRNWAWEPISAQWAEVSALVGVPSASGRLARLEAHADALVVAGTGVVFWGSLHVQVGRLAARLGNIDGAAAHLEAALLAHARCGARPHEARSAFHLAEVLHHRDQPGDADRVGDLVARSLALCAEHSLDGLAAKVNALG
ncbi:MAG: BTAD domain-containing putative transcriptional regulator [Acidimicrobiia bacterium]